MEWLISESSHGGVTARYGISHTESVELGFSPGYMMPGFLEYFSMHFDDRKEAEKYIKKNPNPLKG